MSTVTVDEDFSSLMRPSRREFSRWIVTIGALLAAALIVGLTVQHRSGHPRPAVQTPAVAGGLSLSTSKSALETQATALHRELVREAVGHPVTAVYATGTGPLAGIVVGGGSLSPSAHPADVLRSLAASMRTGALGAQVTNVGSLVTTATAAPGGSQTCLSVTTRKIPVGMCSWTDAGSVGYAIAFDRDGTALGRVLSAMRADLER